MSYSLVLCIENICNTTVNKSNEGIKCQLVIAYYDYLHAIKVENNNITNKYQNVWLGQTIISLAQYSYISLY